MVIEPWDAITAWELGYLDGSAVKYLSRWRKKGGVMDLHKAIHFIEKLIEVENGRLRTAHDSDREAEETGKQGSTKSGLWNGLRSGDDANHGGTTLSVEFRREQARAGVPQELRDVI